MVKIYHGTQIRHLRGIFASGKVIGFWSDEMDYAMSYSMVSGPRACCLPPDNHSVILVSRGNKKDFILDGDPNYLNPKKGYVSANEISHIYRYIGPKPDKWNCYVPAGEGYKQHHYWEKLPVSYFKENYDYEIDSYYNGMIYLDPDPIALEFKDRIMDFNSPIEFKGKKFKCCGIYGKSGISSHLQHVCDSSVSSIILEMGDKYQVWQTESIEFEDLNMNDEEESKIIIENELRIRGVIENDAYGR